jgi:hypothetical protein
MQNDQPKNNGKDWAFLPPRGFATMTPEEYIKERITQFRSWYDGKATKAKSKFMIMRSITVIGGSLVPVLINIPQDPGAIPYMKYATSIISLLVVILVSLESVYHYREQWKNYRSTEQLLAKEYFNFVTGEGVYKDNEAAKAFITLVERVESAIESENASTLNVMTTLTEKKASGNDPSGSLKSGT